MVKRKGVKAALYVRVSTDGQSVVNQERELLQVAEAKGYEVVEVYRDKGISGSKARSQRPGLNAAVKDAIRGRYSVLMVWSVDRLGRSLRDLVETLQELQGAGVDLFLYQQAIDTRTPAGKALFGMLGVFAEFERSIIVERVNAGLARAKAQGTKSGKPIGRPKVPEKIEQRIRQAYEQGMARGSGYGKVSIAREVGCGVSVVQRVLAGA